MTDVADAKASLDQAQTALEQVTADNERFDEVLSWLVDAADRVNELGTYYSGQGQLDIQAVIADDPEAVTPAAANEDAIWEALMGYQDRLLRLLRFVTVELTSELDIDDETDEDDD